LETMSINSDQLSHELAARGYKLTAPRRAVLDVIAGMCESLSPAEIYERSQRRYPRLGLVTVYRTLDLLVEAGVLRRMHRDDGCHSRWCKRARPSPDLLIAHQAVEFVVNDRKQPNASPARRLRIEGTGRGIRALSQKSQRRQEPQARRTIQGEMVRCHTFTFPMAFCRCGW
jgi:Fe2+ or Zn2+ uptake regulation protein